MAVALALHEIDGHEQVELGQRLVEFVAVGAGHDGVAGADQQAADLTLTGSEDLVGELRHGVITGDGREIAQARAVFRLRRHHPPGLG